MVAPNLLKLFLQRDLYIHIGNIHIIRVPPGHVATVTLNNQVRREREKKKRRERLKMDDCHLIFFLCSLLFWSQEKSHTCSRIHCSFLTQRRTYSVQEPITFTGKVILVFWCLLWPLSFSGSLHMLQVPKGKIATVWSGSKPLLLYHRSRPYIVLDNLFRLEAKSEHELFQDSNSEMIHHGSIKRIIPRTGHGEFFLSFFFF